MYINENRMIIRNTDGHILIINRKDFSCDRMYNEYIYNIMLPFTILYKNYFIINNQKQLK